MENLVNLEVNGRSITGNISEKAWKPVGKSYKPFGKGPEREMPEEWKQVIKKHLAEELDGVYLRLLDKANKLDGENGDILVEWMEENLGPDFDKIILEAHYYIGDLEV
jgi:hypothetical protein